jgi:hypothetical protein
MLEPSKSKLNDPERDDAKHWATIERCLELTTKAESLRKRSRKLREVSRLIREDSTRISREICWREFSFNPNE